MRRRRASTPCEMGVTRHGERRVSEGEKRGRVDGRHGWARCNRPVSRVWRFGALCAGGAAARSLVWCGRSKIRVAGGLRGLGGGWRVRRWHWGAPCCVARKSKYHTGADPPRDDGGQQATATAYSAPDDGTQPATSIGREGGHEHSKSKTITIRNCIMCMCVVCDAYNIKKKSSVDSLP
jgi:hypothetical protein